MAGNLKIPRSTVLFAATQFKADGDRRRVPAIFPQGLNNRMRDLDASNRRMTELLNALITADGVRPSILSGVKLMRASRPVPRTPVLYEPSIVIVGQGRKRGYLGGSHLHVRRAQLSGAVRADAV